MPTSGRSVSASLRFSRMEHELRVVSCMMRNEDGWNFYFLSNFLSKNVVDGACLT